MTGLPGFVLHCRITEKSVLYLGVFSAYSAYCSIKEKVCLDNDKLCVINHLAKIMAISEYEIKRCEKMQNAYIDKNRPPAHISNLIDIGYRIKDQSIEIFEIRPQWNNPDKIIEEMQAKTTYVKKTKIWKVYWQRADLKWHRYDPMPEVNSLDEFLALVEADEYCCFKG